MQHDISSSLMISLVTFQLSAGRRSCEAPQLMLLRGFTVSHECVRQWEAKLLPVMGEALRKRRHGTGRRSGQSWYVDETYLKVQGRWCYLYRAIAMARRSRSGSPEERVEDLTAGAGWLLSTDDGRLCHASRRLRRSARRELF
jgi:hypothetical protein